MGVGLYMSRVVLNTLGVEDFGIYGIVGGIVTIFGFLNASMSGATSRFLSFSLGKSDEINLQKTFSAALTIHFLIATTILILAETIGLWFLENKMIIPESRMSAARWVYQFSILSSIISITQVPYNATIIAHERMNIYAYVEILNVCLKLAIVYLLVIGNWDKLVLYTILIFAVSLLIAGIYRVYCLKQFSESKYKFEWDNKLIHPMLSFFGWDTFGIFAGVLRDQGLNLLLNLFFGPAVNAARSIALQVQGSINGFVSNFQTAFRPQLIKNCSSGNVNRMLDLAFDTSKLSFLILAILIFPVIIENPFILNLWLKNVPDYTNIFCRIVLLQSLLSALITPMAYCVHATGKIKLMNIINGILYTTIIPISYIFFHLGFSPVYGFITNLILSIIGFFIWLWLLKRIVNYSIKDYFYKVVLKCLTISVLSLPLPLAVHFILDYGWYRFILVLCSSFIFTITFSYWIVMDKNMRKQIHIMLKNKFQHE
jgi:O-antigen/teichoic acid export membrane protein